MNHGNPEGSQTTGDNPLTRTLEGVVRAGPLLDLLPTNRGKLVVNVNTGQLGLQQLPEGCVQDLEEGLKGE